VHEVLEVGHIVGVDGRDRREHGEAGGFELGISHRFDAGRASCLPADGRRQEPKTADGSDHANHEGDSMIRISPGGNVGV
jgi:hypothetical protein